MSGLSGPSLLFIGGLACGGLAGASAQFGRLCTFSAIEDVVAAGDWRRARAFALALVTALLATQGLLALGVISLQGNPYAAQHLELAGLATGAFLFGLGMALVGTCGFGLLIRAGTGDLRAGVTAGLLGVFAAASAGGIISSPRLWLSQAWTIPMPSIETAAAGIVTPVQIALTATALISAVLLIGIFRDERFRRRRNLILAGLLLGTAVCLGWIVTGVLSDPFDAQRPESLTFVGPLSRSIQIAMGERIEKAAFAVATVVGVILGSLAVAAVRDELRLEAFDDPREMSRHILGALLMGFGGMLAKGCTIGQGLSASSALSAMAPIAILFMILGARAGIFYLIEGPPKWLDAFSRRARSQRPE